MHGGMSLVQLMCDGVQCLFCQNLIALHCQRIRGGVASRRRTGRHRIQRAGAANVIIEAFSIALLEQKT